MYSVGNRANKIINKQRRADPQRCRVYQKSPSPGTSQKNEHETYIDGKNQIPLSISKNNVDIRSPKPVFQAVRDKMAIKNLSESHDEYVKFVSNSWQKLWAETQDKNEGSVVFHKEPENCDDLKDFVPFSLEDWLYQQVLESNSRQAGPESEAYGTGSALGTVVEKREF